MFNELHRNKKIRLPILICKWIYALASRGSPRSVMILIWLNKDNVFDLQFCEKIKNEDRQSTYLIELIVHPD